MKPREPVDDGQQDLFRARLDQIIDMQHPKVVLAQAIDWDWLAEQIGAVYKDGRGYPPLQARLMAGLHILKYMDNLSDEEVCRRFVENPINTSAARCSSATTCRLTARHFGTESCTSPLSLPTFQGYP